MMAPGRAAYCSFEVWRDGLDAAAAAHHAVAIDTAHMFGDGDPDEFG